MFEEPEHVSSLREEIGELLGFGFCITIHGKLARLLKPAKTKKLESTSECFPSFRFADFHRAAENFLVGKKVTKIASAHHEELPDLLSKKGHLPTRLLNVAATELTAVGWQEEESFPEDCFWVFEDGETRGVLRVRKQHYGGLIKVELATNSGESLRGAFDEIVELSKKHSVYRNHLLTVGFEEPISDEYGQVQTPNQLSVTFRPDPNISAEDIVLDPQIEAVLQRNVVSFHHQRDRLSELGLPLQRGVLLHGPPGTGKTYTCQYLFGCMKPVTMLVVAGKSLTQVKSVCNLARLLAPCVVVLEDVDLIFASREINLYSTGLGELMDELDGFQRDEAITFILTTNAIDRLEAAIKDRPGRISQCVFMGPPTKELRERYLKRFLRSYDVSALNFSHLGQLSEGASQAFLQELVYRSVQICSESMETNEQLKLQNAHFEEAMLEMTGHTEKASASIIGFRRNGAAVSSSNMGP